MRTETDGRAVIVERHPGCASFTGSTAAVDDWRMPATMDDPALLDEITDALGSIGYSAGG